MESKPRKTPDHISFIYVSIVMLACSQYMENLPWPIGHLFRAIFLAVAVISGSVAIYLYDRARKI